MSDIATSIRNRLIGLGRRGQRSGYFWGFLDQALSSATNFGLSLIAGRLLGPSGLGTVFLGFSVYLIVLALQRSLLTEVLVVVTSALDRDRRAHTGGIALTLSILVGLLAMSIVLVLLPLFSGPMETALILIAPWLPVLMLQDYWRSLLFRERRAAAAAANDGIWFVVMAASLPIAWMFKSELAVTSVWGLGAAGGAIAGFYQTRLRPSPFRESLVWWRRDAWPFGRWNAAASIVVNVASNASAFFLAAILGSQALGGFRAVQSLFAPLSLIAPALALPGLPAVTRAYARGFRRARVLTMRISAIAVGISLAFFAALFIGGWRLLPLLFGDAFERYRDIVPALAVSQVLSAAGVGFPLLIKAQQRGRFLLMNRLFVSIIGLGIIALGAAEYGLIGAAWAIAAAMLISTLWLGIGALREPTGASLARPAPSQPTGDAGKP
jgi:O-antigen/teichoic acid export membrane protein